MATFICPNCRSTNLRRSRVQGFGEEIQKIVNRKPFRCRDCGWRGMMYSHQESGGTVSKKKAYTFMAALAFIVLVLLAVFNLRPDVIENIVRQLIGK